MLLIYYPYTFRSYWVATMLIEIAVWHARGLRKRYCSYATKTSSKGTFGKREELWEPNEVKYSLIKEGKRFLTNFSTKQIRKIIFWFSVEINEISKTQRAVGRYITSCYKLKYDI